MILIKHWYEKITNNKIMWKILLSNYKINYIIYKSCKLG